MTANTRERLRLEAECIETAMLQRIERTFSDASNQASMWQPGPCPDDWLPPERRR